jgi:hypothetical protein
MSETLVLYLSRPSDGLDALPMVGGSVNISPSYELRIGEILAIHTGSPSEYLTLEQDQALATAIQNGLAAAKLLAELGGKTTPAAREYPGYHEALTAIKAGEQAKDKLVECNMKLPVEIARRSMGLLPSKNNRLPWLPKNITSLKSPFADLEDRVQVAGLDSSGANL